MLERFRKERNPKIVSILQKMGYDITMKDVEDISQGEIIGRPHIAKVLVEKGYYKNTRQVFENLLGFGKPAYVKRDKLKPVDAILAIKSANGIAILAHPHKFLYIDEGIENILRELKEYGLDGIEVYHSEHSQSEIKSLIDIAKRLDLSISGGSDFHGENKPDIKLGVGKGNLFVGDEILEELKRKAHIKDE